MLKVKFILTIFCCVSFNCSIISRAVESAVISVNIMYVLKVLRFNGTLFNAVFLQSKIERFLHIQKHVRSKGT